MMSSQLLQSSEFLYGENESYLVMHKCGSSSVAEAMNWPHGGPVPQPGKITFTVVRDPIERFISGYIHDIYNAGIVSDSMDLGLLKDTVREHIDKYDIYDVYAYINNFNKRRNGVRGTGSVPHTVSQISYMLGQSIDWFIDIKDLTTFLQVHYGKARIMNNERTDRDAYNLIKNILLKEKQRLIDIHQIDYYYIERMKAAGMFWDWQSGRIF